MNRLYRDPQRIQSVLTTRWIKFTSRNSNVCCYQAARKAFASFISSQDKHKLQWRDDLCLVKDRIHRTSICSLRTYNQISDEKGHFNLKRSYQTVSHDPPSNPKKEKVSGSSRFRETALFGAKVICAFSVLWFIVGDYVQDNIIKSILDPAKFTPFEIIKRETISPTSFLLTLQTSLINQPSLDPDPYKESWEKGIWSVEAKQPELQIARSYTPLPPISGESPENIKLLIRKEYQGEMTSYLNRLFTGSPLQLRGPHQELEIPKEVNQVLFFAGGTGIAPALQVVHQLLERREANGDRPSIHIVWANRRREDCQGGGREFSTGKSSFTSPGENNNNNPIVEYLREMQHVHPGQLKVQYFVDEENTTLTQRNISQLVNRPEGFIQFIAGPKELENGKQVQGKLGGVLGKINLKDWNVWKL